MMLSSKLCPVTRRVGIVSSANIAGGRRVLQNIIDTRAPTSNTCRFLTNEQEKHFHEMGCLDKQGMTAFSTLHELQVNSTLVYSENELFGTYNEESKSFQYMTYSEYNEKVNQCRALLKDLGECHATTHALDILTLFLH